MGANLIIPIIVSLFRLNAMARADEQGLGTVGFVVVLMVFVRRGGVSKRFVRFFGSGQS